MTYIAPGMRELPAGKLIPMFASEITKIKGWEVGCSDTLKKLGRGGRRVSALSNSDIVAMEGTGQFAAGQPSLRALQHLLMRFLHSLGVVTSYPVVLTYSANAALAFSEGLDLMQNEDCSFPPISDFGGFESFNLESLVSNFPNVIRKLAHRKSKRSHYVRLLRMKLQQIAWQIANGKDVIDGSNQAEMSFFLAYCDQFNARSCIDGIGEGPTLASAADVSSGPTLRPFNTGDPLVADVWAQWVRCTMPGPYLQYLSMQSNCSLEHLLYWLGPQQSALAYAVGTNSSFGVFDEVLIDDVPIILPWTLIDQMDAARERSAGYLAGPEASIRAPVSLANPALSQQHTALRWDVPGVQVVVPANAVDLRPVEFNFMSTWRDRILTSANGVGATTLTLLQDIAFKNERAGGAISSGKSWQDFKFVDMQASAEHLGIMMPYEFDERQVYRVLVPLPDSRMVEEKTVDMTDYFTRNGANFYPPSFREYATVPLSWLERPNENEENYIAAVLGINNEQMKQARRVIRISFNFAHLSALLPDSAQLPLTYEQLIKYCASVRGGV